MACKTDKPMTPAPKPTSSKKSSSKDEKKKNPFAKK